MTRRPLVVGRELELAAVEQFVVLCGTGPASLVLEGVAGIGKSSIWAESIAMAQTHGIAVRSCRCSQADATWSFAGLGDLLDGLEPTIIDQLPAIQQQALAAAMLTVEASGGPAGDRVVAVAFLSVLRALARAGPVLIAVDDVQWLDSSTRRVLSFALRRLRDEPVRLLTARRIGTVDSVPEGVDTGDLELPGERLPIGPVSVGAAARILRNQLTLTLSRPTLTRLHQATGGNPMVCIEMARALQRRGHEPAADEPLPVPADLRLLIAERLRGLRPESRRLLLLAAAMAQPTVETLVAAIGDHPAASLALAEVLAAGVVELDGSRLRFTHPLLASIPYTDLRPDERRELHAALAAAVKDPQEHARHAALGSVGPDPTVATALDSAARHARSRGSLESAVELAMLAISRTPLADDDRLLKRRVDAAEYLFRLGDMVRARATLNEALDATPAGPERVRGLLLLASVVSWEEGDEQVAAFCEQAITEAGSDPLLLARCHAAIAEAGPYGPAVDLIHAQTAVRLMEAMTSPPSDLLANALTNVALHGLRLGHGLAVSLLERAAALQTVDDRPGIVERAAMGLAMSLKHIDRFDDSRAWLDTMRTSALDEGDESALPMILGQLALLECWAGRYELALSYAVDGREIAQRVGLKLPGLNSAHVLVLAHLGRNAEAQALGDADFASDEAVGYLSALPLHLRGLAFVDVSQGDPAAAAEKYLRALAINRDVGTAEPAMLRLHPDAVAALVAIGDIAGATQLTAELDESRSSLALPWASAMAGRCQGLLHAAAGDMARASVHLEQALVDHDRLPMPFEEARTQLLFGTVLNRAGHRNDARRVLGDAHHTFVNLGTPVQASQAARALSSIGGRSGSVVELTTVEGRVAELAGAGKTNREVAEALFMSVRTVESHLGRVYRKLSVRSRTELSRTMSAESHPPTG